MTALQFAAAKPAIHRDNGRRPGASINSDLPVVRVAPWHRCLLPEGRHGGDFQGGAAPRVDPISELWRVLTDGCNVEVARREIGSPDRYEGRAGTQMPCGRFHLKTEGHGGHQSDRVGDRAKESQS